MKALKGPHGPVCRIDRAMPEIGAAPGDLVIRDVDAGRILMTRTISADDLPADLAHELGFAVQVGAARAYPFLARLGGGAECQA